MSAKIEVKIPNVSHKYYSYSELVDGVNTVFRYVKKFDKGRSSWVTVNHFVGISNGVIVTSHFNREVCIDLLIKGL